MRNIWKSVSDWFPAFVAGAMVTGACLTSPLQVSADDVIARTFKAATGEVYSSLSLKLPKELGQRQNVDHVILIDTSASQVGEHRKQSFAVIDSFVRSLPSTDRVAVIAVDVSTAPMTEGFLSPEIASTTLLTNLNNRFPAGATNLLAGLEEAARTLQGSTTGSILLIGDGMSVAHLMQVDEVQQITATFRENQIPIHSYAVGSKTDMKLLGILAEETGGFVVRDEYGQQALTATQAGQLLAQAANRTVFYPESVKANWDQANLLPNRPLPIRSDRETVYLTNSAVPAGAIFSADETTWTIEQTKRTAGNTFLANLYNNNLADDGIGLGMAGDWMVNLAHEAFEDGVATMAQSGVDALQTGEFEAAEQIGFEIQSIDPGNVQAVSLIEKAGEAQLNQGAKQQALMLAQLDTEPAPGVDSTAPPTPPNPAGTMLEAREQPSNTGGIENYESLRAAKGQKLQREVEEEIKDANAILEYNPDQAADILERTNGAVKSATDIAPDLRNQLLRRVNAALDDVRKRSRQIEKLNAESNRRAAEAESGARLIEFAEARDNQLAQMVDRIRALMEDGYHGDPSAFEQAEAVGRQVQSEFPGTATATSVVFMPEAAGQLDKSERLRALRSDRLLEVLYQVELSHVPFPDEPPVRYPAAEVWWALTELRQKWKSVDLHSNSPNEQKIYEALESTTSFEFNGNPLSEVIAFIQEQHNIPIRLNETLLSESGIGPDEEVTLVLSGISLKSALKLMLEDVGGVELTYIIEDEVMKITTIEDAEERLQTRVYPVADLVIPILPLGGGFGSGGTGGFGGGQGFGGQGGGGQGGQQGGQGGQQGGGQGGGQGGFFSLPSGVVDADLKKKP